MTVCLLLFVSPSRILFSFPLPTVITDSMADVIFIAGQISYKDGLAIHPHLTPVDPRLSAELLISNADKSQDSHDPSLSKPVPPQHPHFF
jgi:hypothetical protein